MVCLIKVNDREPGPDVNYTDSSLELRFLVKYANAPYDYSWVLITSPTLRLSVRLNGTVPYRLAIISSRASARAAGVKSQDAPDATSASVDCES